MRTITPAARSVWRSRSAALASLALLASACGGDAANDAGRAANEAGKAVATAASRAAEAVGTAAGRATAPDSPLRDLKQNAEDRLVQVRDGLRTGAADVDVEHITGVDSSDDRVTIRTDWGEANREAAERLCRRAYNIGIGRAPGTPGRVTIEGQNRVALAECG